VGSSQGVGQGGCSSRGSSNSSSSKYTQMLLMLTLAICYGVEEETERDKQSVPLILFEIKQYIKKT
jgi:hypothetical protein